MFWRIDKETGQTEAMPNDKVAAKLAGYYKDVPAALEAARVGQMRLATPYAYYEYAEEI